MRIHLGIPGPCESPMALTIGNFDGVHLGHQAMLHALKLAAAPLGLPTGVVTFEPHPREFFSPADAPPRLTTLREKLELLDAAGMEHVFVLRFRQALATLPAETFISEWLVHRLRARWLLVGDDFRFGARRAGDFDMLRNAGSRYGFECFSLSSIMAAGRRVSSSAVRETLAAGQLDLAGQLLGRPFFMSGRVMPGNRLGRTLGYPTANIRVGRRIPPLSGIFAVSVAGLGEKPLPAVASLGTRPTISSDGEYLLEVHLFEFDQDIYGHRIHVHFLHKLRDEARFESLEALTRQMACDAQAARDYFAQQATF
ncbi:MAG: bifunctional riboflavin kinase/FAD synthetase [Betaproteobacteria bacterium]|nr:bifunctional riboflavin kinase/FAD synthetase [Betaproteobacteria bacterium]